MISFQVIKLSHCYPLACSFLTLIILWQKEVIPITILVHICVCVCHTDDDDIFNEWFFLGMDQMSKHMHAAAAAAAMAEKSSSSIGLIPAAELMEKNIHHYGSSSTSSQERKKRLTSDQLESLERSFQEEIKLDPDRKMKLARELGLQPRQIAVWFQNRRARWKSKQLELLYDSLKQDYDAVSREKLKLQEEVISVKFFFHSFIQKT